MAVYTKEELNKLSTDALILIIMNQQEQLESMNQKLDWLMEQIRVANNDRYGHKSEKLNEFAHQMSLFELYPTFNEAEVTADSSVEEPEVEEVVIRRKKQKGKRQEDFKNLHEEFYNHPVSGDELNTFFGEGNWRRFKDDHYDRLRYQPATWVVERHTVEVYVGTGGEHQDEFLRGVHDPGLLRGSFLSESLEAAIMNGKFVNALPFYRIEQELKRNDINISRQTMANWTIACAEKYLAPLYEALKQELLKYHVNQADETPVQVLNLQGEEDTSRTKSYMWVHRSGEFYKDKPIVLYEFQHGRAHEYPLAFYKDFKGILMTDGLQQYHILDRKLENLTSANCWAHARRDYSDAIKAMDKSNPEAVKKSIAWKALVKIGAIYHLEEELKDRNPETRRRHRQASIKPLVDDYFKWIKELKAEFEVLPKGKTSEGINYSINQEKYLRIFLDDGEVPIDNSASERAIRPFTIGRKNWVLINSEKGAVASAIIYSITETAKLNNLKPYYYLEHILRELPKIVKDGVVQDSEKLKTLFPWAVELPDNCKIKERS